MNDQPDNDNRPRRGLPPMAPRRKGDEPSPAPPPANPFIPLVDQPELPANQRPVAQPVPSAVQPCRTDGASSPAVPPSQGSRENLVEKLQAVQRTETGHNLDLLQAGQPECETPPDMGRKIIPRAEYGSLETRKPEAGLPSMAPVKIKPPVDVPKSALQSGDQCEGPAVVSTILGLPRWAWGVASLVLVFLLLVVFRLYTETIATISHLATLPTVVAYGLFVVLILLLTAVGFLTYKLSLGMFRLRPNRPVLLSQVRKLGLGDRTAYYGAAHEHLKKSFVPAYAGDWHAGRREIFRDKFKVLEETLVRIDKALERLAATRCVDPEEWVVEFQRTLVDELDEIGRQRMMKYAKLVGVKTALAPYRILDTLAVLYNNMKLLKDLCLIYNQRVEGFAAYILLGRVIANTYIAGEVEQAIDHVAENLDEEIADAVGNQLGGRLLEFVSKKTAEGFANALLTHRLGRKAQQYLTPIRG